MKKKKKFLFFHSVCIKYSTHISRLKYLTKKKKRKKKKILLPSYAVDSFRSNRVFLISTETTTTKNKIDLTVKRESHTKRNIYTVYEREIEKTEARPQHSWNRRSTALRSARPSIKHFRLKAKKKDIKWKKKKKRVVWGFLLRWNVQNRRQESCFRWITEKVILFVTYD